MLGDILTSSERESLCLSDFLPKGKKYDKIKRDSEKVAESYWGTEFYRYHARMGDCAKSLAFRSEVDPDTGEMINRLDRARFCRCRHCIVCQTRRVLMWASRLRKVTPELLAAYPQVEFIFLTLTVRNIPVENLRETLVTMNKAWQRLTQRRQFPAVGFIKSVEVTRSENSRAGDAHPHFHCLLAVPRTYFGGRTYLSQAKWRELWQSCLRVDYLPMVHVRKVRGKNGIDDPIEALVAGIVETVKYTVKPEDLVSDREWLIELTRQMHKSRAIALGGIFREFLREDESDETEPDEPEIDSDTRTLFEWKPKQARYMEV